MLPEDELAARLQELVYVADLRFQARDRTLGMYIVNNSQVVSILMQQRSKKITSEAT